MSNDENHPLVLKKDAQHEDTPRYRVAPESGHGCCWDASVVDVTKPTIFKSSGHYRSDGILQYETVCEGMTTDCVRIAEVLNKENI